MAAPPPPVLPKPVLPAPVLPAPVLPAPVLPAPVLPAAPPSSSAAASAPAGAPERSSSVLTFSTRLHQAARDGDLAAVRACAEAGDDLDAHEPVHGVRQQTGARARERERESWKGRTSAYRGDGKEEDGARRERADGARRDREEQMEHREGGRERRGKERGNERRMLGAGAVPRYAVVALSAAVCVSLSLSLSRSLVRRCGTVYAATQR